MKFHGIVTWWDKETGIGEISSKPGTKAILFSRSGLHYGYEPQLFEVVSYNVSVSGCAADVFLSNLEVAVANGYCYNSVKE